MAVYCLSIFRVRAYFKRTTKRLNWLSLSGIFLTLLLIEWKQKHSTAFSMPSIAEVPELVRWSWPAKVPAPHFVCAMTALLSSRGPPNCIPNSNLKGESANAFHTKDSLAMFNNPSDLCSIANHCSHHLLTAFCSEFLFCFPISIRILKQTLYQFLLLGVLLSQS